jgi:hypothetical protein
VGRAVIAHPQVQTELLLRREFALDAIGPDPVHRNARCVRSPGNQPIHVDDRELGEQRSLSQVDQSKGAAEGPRRAERTITGRKTALLEGAFGYQFVRVDLGGGNR